MSEKLSKPEKKRVPPFVGPEDAGRSTEKPMPEKPKTNPEEYMLFKKLDVLTNALKDLKETIEEKEKGITHQLCRIADALGKEPPTFVQNIVSPEVTKATQNQPATEPPAGRQVEDVRMLFTKELEELLNFEDKGDWIRVAPIKYLGSDNFAKIASVIRTAGGEYISAGKESHFRIPK